MEALPEAKRRDVGAGGGSRDAPLLFRIDFGCAPRAVGAGVALLCQELMSGLHPSAMLLMQGSCLKIDFKCYGKVMHMHMRTPKQYIQVYSSPIEKSYTRPSA